MPEKTLVERRLEFLKGLEGRLSQPMDLRNLMAVRHAYSNGTLSQIGYERGLVAYFYDGIQRTCKVVTDPARMMEEVEGWGADGREHRLWLEDVCL